MEQRTIHGLQPPEQAKIFNEKNDYRELSELAEQAKRRAEVARIVNAGFSRTHHVPPARTIAHTRRGPQLEPRQTSVARTHRTASPRAGPPIEYNAFGSSHCVCASCHADFGTRKGSAVESRRKGKLNALQSYRPYQLYVKVI